LYQVVGNVCKPVWSVNGELSTDEAEKAVGIKKILDGSVEKFTINRENKNASKSFSFTFRNLRMAEGLTFFREGNISNGNSITTPKKLSIWFDPMLKAQDYDNSFTDVKMPGFHVTWR